MDNPIARVRRVIEATGLTQGEFAQKVGLDAPKLSKSLSGTRRFSSLDYARIAEIGNVTVDYLLTGEETQFAVAARAAAGAGREVALEEAERLTELRATATRLGHPQPLDGFVVRERQAHAAGRLDLPATAPDRFRRYQLRDVAKNEGVTLAHRATAHLQHRGLSSADVDLASVIERAFGIDVAVTPLGLDFDGLAVSADGAAIILAAPVELFARQRFTMAHELGHILTADTQDLHLDPDIDKARHSSDVTEVRANSFAAAFLIPEALVRQRVTRDFADEAFKELAMDLAVSPQPLAIRLNSLNLIDDWAKNSWKSLSLAEAARGVGRGDEYATRTQAAMQSRAPGLLGRDLVDAYVEGKTTLRPAARLFDLPTDQLRASLDSMKAEG